MILIIKDHQHKQNKPSALFYSHKHLKKDLGGMGAPRQNLPLMHIIYQNSYKITLLFI